MSHSTEFEDVCHRDERYAEAQRRVEETGRSNLDRWQQERAATVSDNYKPTRNHWKKWTEINNFTPLVVDSAEYFIKGVLERPFAPTGPGVGKLRKAEAFLHFMCLLKGEDGQVRSPDDIHKEHMVPHSLNKVALSECCGLSTYATKEDALFKPAIKVDGHALYGPQNTDYTKKLSEAIDQLFKADNQKAQELQRIHDVIVLSTKAVQDLSSKQNEAHTCTAETVQQLSAKLDRHNTEASQRMSSLADIIGVYWRQSEQVAAHRSKTSELLLTCTAVAVQRLLAITETRTAEAVQLLSSLSSDVAKATTRVETKLSDKLRQADACTAEALAKLESRISAKLCGVESRIFQQLSAKADTRPAEAENHKAPATAEAVQQLSLLFSDTAQTTAKTETHIAEALQATAKAVVQLSAKVETHTAEAVRQAAAQVETHTAAAVQQLSSLSSDVAKATAKKVRKLSECSNECSSEEPTISDRRTVRQAMMTSSDKLDIRERRLVEEANRRAKILGTDPALASLNGLELALTSLADLLGNRLQIKSMTSVNAQQFPALKALGDVEAEKELDGTCGSTADGLKNRLLAAIVEADPQAAGGFGGRVNKAIDAKKARCARKLVKASGVQVDSGPFKSAVSCWITSLFT
eukprot:jgi/Astpho2/5186/fgenesh1_pg.00074_%23_18_t